MNKIISALLCAGLGLSVFGCAASAGEEILSESDEALSARSTVWERVTCESWEYRYNSCDVNTHGGRLVDVRVVRQLSHAPGHCNQGESFGTGPNYVWVDRGCRAEFEVRIEVQPQPPQSERIRCASNDYRYTVCSSNLRGIRRIRLIRQESSAACTEGTSFGFHDDAMWVDYGCRGEFEVFGGGPSSNCGVLASGQSLNMNQSVTSCDGRNQFIHQGDGHVVLYHDGRALWWTGVVDSWSNVLAMQGDGNLVQYDRSNRAIWSTGTHNNPGAWLNVQDDCNVVVYDRYNRALWHSNTYGCYQH